jgi:hypothetical protein
VGVAREGPKVFRATAHAAHLRMATQIVARVYASGTDVGSQPFVSDPREGPAGSGAGLAAGASRALQHSGRKLRGRRRSSR